MFVFKIVVTTLVCIVFLILGFTLPKLKGATEKAIFWVTTVLYILCLIGMWF